MSDSPLPSALVPEIMSHASGLAPGVPSVQQSQMTAVMAHGGADLQHISAYAICPPSALEYAMAIRAGAEALQHTTDGATRALLMQHDVMLRYQNFQLTQSCSSLSSGSKSFQSPSSSTGTSSADDSPRTFDAVAGSSAVGVIIVPAPAKVFRCPVCPQVLDERCFAKHIDSWLARDGTKRLRSNQCPGFPLNHKFLSAFEGTHRERVRCLHASVRVMLHPGCTAAQSPRGSGNHIAVEAYFRNLLS
jgi:hypothetical protein